MTLRHSPFIRREYLDTSTRVAPLGNRTKTLLLVGFCSNDTTGSDGALVLGENDPYHVTDFETAYSLSLNHDATPSELSEALLEAIAYGADDIYIMRSSMIYSYEEKICNVVTGAGHQVSGFSSAGGEVPAFTSATLLTPEDRFDAFTTTYTTLEDYNFADVIVPVGAYIDESVETGSKDFGYQCALHCYKVSKTGKECHGVLPVSTALQLAYSSDATVDYRKGTPTITQLSAWKTYLLNAGGTNYGLKNFDPKTPGSLTAFPQDDTTTTAPTNHAYFLNSAETVTPTVYSSAVQDPIGAPIDLGRYVVVVATNSRFYNRAATTLYPIYGYYNKNAYVAIAAIKTTLGSTESLTHREVSIYGQETVNRSSIYDVLNGQGFVTILSSGDVRRIGVGYTAAYHVSPYMRSDWDLEFNTRVVSDLLNELRTELSPFLGSRKYTGIELKTKEVVNRYVVAGAIIDGNVTVYTSATLAAIGVVNVQLNVTVGPELRQIVTYTTLSVSTE